VRLYRFDPEVSIPVDQFGSDFRIGRLTGDGTTGRVQIMHLPPGGAVGRHRAALRQLFAVVAGSGSISGDDGSCRPIQAGQAAVWEPGEEHGATSEEGLTAVCVEGSFEMSAIAVTMEIVVADYDPQWAGWFDELCAHIWPAVDGMALRIDHVGSTSVPGLAAKPIIDMDIVVAAEAQLQPVIEAVSSLGYRWIGDLGVVGRQVLEATAGTGATGLPPHHLYLVVENNKAHLDHVLLRDLLREDPEARRRYGDLKRANVDLAQGDMDVYVAAKARLVAELLTRARAERGLPPAEYWEPDVAGLIGG
jgi:GrpB-like predicted nucleotidyltransferase (UPF0157 family)/quercetin dioxygenase-like cupin family protein